MIYELIINKKIIKISVTGTPLIKMLIKPNQQESVGT